MVRNRLKKCVLSLQIIVCSLLFSACSGSLYSPGNSGEYYFPEENQVKNYVDGKISTFGLNIAPANEMGDWVIKWLSNVTDGDGFQYYIYADPDSWDVYLYYPKEQANIEKLTNDDVAVECSEGVLRVYITPTDAGSSSAEGEEIWMLHFAAYPFGAWPSEVELYWDGHEVARDIDG